MTQLLRVSLKIFVFQFYKANMGFFFFWFIFFFGIVSPHSLISYHLALIQAQVDSTLILIGAIFCWTLYDIMCIRFFERIIIKYRDSFLHVLQVVPSAKLNILIGTFHTLVFLPCLTYAVIVAVIAGNQEKQGVAIIIGSFLIFITVAGTRWLKMNLAKRTGSKIFLLPGNGRRTIHYIFYLLQFILKERKVTALVLKIASFFLFFIVFIRLGDGFDKVSFTNVLLLIVYLHAVLVYHAHKFIEERARFLRNLPISFAGRIIVFLVPICVIFIPELLFMLVNDLPMLTSPEIVVYYFLLVSQLLLYLVLLYTASYKLKDYIKILFAVGFGLIFLCRGVNLYWVILLQFSAAFIIFRIRYYKYEHVVFIT